MLEDLFLHLAPAFFEIDVLWKKHLLSSLKHTVLFFFLEGKNSSILFFTV